jgi:NTP pyrophosphatase (non-canonical NTP hydrolase)
LTNDPVRAFAILSEEIGEVAKEILEVSRPGVHVADAIVSRILLGHELAQVAATAMLMIQNLNLHIKEHS